MMLQQIILQRYTVAGLGRSISFKYEICVLNLCNIVMQMKSFEERVKVKRQTKGFEKRDEE